MGKAMNRSHSSRHRRMANLAACVLPFACLGTIAVISGPFWPPLGVPPGRANRAAIAIRDDVTPLEKWGTRAFTIGQLEAAYDRVVYLTESASDTGRSEFVAGLTGSLAKYDHVDLFLLAHTNDWIAWLDGIDGGARERIRLVYNSGCWGAQQGPDWIAAGADAYIGHPARSESPLFYYYFLRQWLRGASVETALEASNADAHRLLSITGGVMYPGRPLDTAWRETRATPFGDGSVRIAEPTP